MNMSLKIAASILLSSFVLSSVQAGSNPHVTNPQSKVVKAKGCKIAQSQNRAAQQERATKHCQSKHRQAQVKTFNYEALACTAKRLPSIGITYSVSFDCAKGISKDIKISTDRQIIN